MKSIFIGIVALLAAAASSGAPIIFNNPVGTPFLSSHSIGDDQFLGTRFSLGGSYQIESVDAVVSYGNGLDLFAAIVALPTEDSFPTASSAVGLADLTQVVAFGLFNPGFIQDAPSVINIPFDIELSAGAYAVVFGSGLFGSSSSAHGALQNYASVAGSNAMAWVGPNDLWYETDYDFIAGGVVTYSVSVRGNPIPSVPDESATAALLLSALLGLVGRHHLRDR